MQRIEKIDPRSIENSYGYDLVDPGSDYTKIFYVSIDSDIKFTANCVPMTTKVGSNESNIGRVLLVESLEEIEVPLGFYAKLNNIQEINELGVHLTESLIFQNTSGKINLVLIYHGNGMVEFNKGTTVGVVSFHKM